MLLYASKHVCSFFFFNDEPEQDNYTRGDGSRTKSNRTSIQNKISVPRLQREVPKASSTSSISRPVPKRCILPLGLPWRPSFSSPAQCIPMTIPVYLVCVSSVCLYFVHLARVSRTSRACYEWGIYFVFIQCVLGLNVCI